MKLIHLADLHIGKSLNDYSLIDDQRYILQQILQLARQHQADAMLLAGDIYDKAVPSEEAVRLLDEFLQGLTELNLPAFIISGNHDSDERLNFGSRLFTKNQIYIAAKYNGQLYQKTLQDEFGPVNFYLLPFVKASQVRHFFPEAAIASYDDAVRLAVGQAEIDVSQRNVLLTHQFVTGRGAETNPELAGSETAAALTVGTVERVFADCFAAFDYVAMGHIHAPQPVGGATVRYAGSPLKYSLAEVNNQKSVPLISLGPKGDCQVELLPLRPRRELRRLKGRLNQLLSPENIQNTDDYIYAVLTDEEPITNAMGIFRQYYPNTLKIGYDNAHTQAAAQPDPNKIRVDKPPLELVADFYQMMYGCEISPAELQIMQQAAQKAGVPL